MGDKFCLYPTAEVLTDIGWISLKDLDITTRKVATMDPATHILSYVTATQKYEFDYDSEVDGKMYYFKSKSVHTVSTPNHKHYVKGPKAANYEFRDAAILFDKSIKFKKNCVNNFREASTVTLTDRTGIRYTHPINSYLKLLGMFISDGCTSKFSLHLCMRKDRKREYVRALEPALGVTFNYNDIHALQLCKGRSKGLYEEFKKLSVGANNKRLPKYVWNLGPNNCKALLEGLANGDGTFNTSGTMKYCTSSELLADDVQRLIFHCGFVGTIQISTQAGTSSYFEEEERMITSKHDNYAVIVNKKEMEPLLKGHKTNTYDEKWVDYKGKVMCIEIPNTHLFYYRENRISPPIWTGNSSRSG